MSNKSISLSNEPSTHIFLLLNLHISLHSELIDSGSALKNFSKESYICLEIPPKFESYLCITSTYIHFYSRALLYCFTLWGNVIITVLLCVTRSLFVLSPSNSLLPSCQGLIRGHVGVWLSVSHSCKRLWESQ